MTIVCNKNIGSAVLSTQAWAQRKGKNVPSKAWQNLHMRQQCIKIMMIVCTACVRVKHGSPVG